jgi:hypothetical protein
MEENKMKKITSLLIGAALMMATSAMALPTLSGGYNWVDSPFWTTSAATTGSKFSLILENAAYESDFGLFSVTGSLENPGAVETKFKIFDYLQEPTTSKTVYFNNDGSVSLNGRYYTEFDKQFGFYFSVHTGGATDNSADYTFYSYNLFNTSDAGIDHILTAYNSDMKRVMIYLDDQLVATGSDSDFNDMVVNGNCLSPVSTAPVPEPGTMVLLGFGMLGLAIYGKRRMNKES